MTKTELKTTIERIVEKKVKLEVKKQLSEILIKESAHSPKIAKPKVKKQVVLQKEMIHYTCNESLNKILNETANGDWKTLGGEGKVFDTNNMADMLGYGDMGRGGTKEQKLNVNAAKTLSDANVSTEQVPDHVMKALTRDYSDLMKHDKMKGK